MVFTRIHRVYNAFGAGQTNDITFSLRGGILLSLKLTNSPREYFQPGTSEAVPKYGDIHVYIGDSATASFILGQDVQGVIIVPATSSWTWYHPFKNEITNALPVIEKLALYPFPIQQIGGINGNFRVIASWDPALPVQHALVVEAEFAAFDLNLS